MRAGIGIEGTNAEVMMGQWEFQIGILAASAIGDQLWTRAMAAQPDRRGVRGPRELRREAHPGRLERSGCSHQLLDQGDAATGGYEPIIAGAEALGTRVKEHIRATATTSRAA